MTEPTDRAGSLCRAAIVDAEALLDSVDGMTEALDDGRRRAEMAGDFALNLKARRAPPIIGVCESASK